MYDVFVYFVDLPAGISEMVTPCPDGYTIYIDAGLDREHMWKAYQHAMRHIKNRDFEKDDVQGIEGAAHA